VKKPFPSFEIEQPAGAGPGRSTAGVVVVGAVVGLPVGLPVGEGVVPLPVAVAVPDIGVVVSVVPLLLSEEQAARPTPTTVAARRRRETRSAERVLDRMRGIDHI
jgi:hypothetical protein